VAQGTDTLVVTGGDADSMVRVAASGDVLELTRGAACVVPHGVAYSVAATGPATVFRASVPAGDNSAA
jgi:hypothetical protein